MLGDLRLLPIEQLHVDPVNPRDEPGDIDDLAASIAEFGVLNPMLVREHDGGYGVLSGSRRLACAHRLALPRCPVRLLHPADDVEALAIATAENVGRKAMNPIEEARAYRALLDTGLTQQQVADRVGVSGAKVSMYQRLLDLPADLQDRVRDGALTITRAIDQHGRRYKPSKKNRGRHVSATAITGGWKVPDDLVGRLSLAVKKRRYDSTDALVERAVRRELVNPSCQARDCLEGTVGDEGRFCAEHLRALAEIRVKLYRREAARRQANGQPFEGNDSRELTEQCARRAADLLIHGPDRQQVAS